ncbi:hypothetical protein ABEF92_007190 [Exophiala dermatitidis]|uniref:Uncharacterized protein n=2 Tax=Exophiala dermatitidis TaxID=5970 RepID=H6C413_EXODN|nr:uncharacterized protein HMPREF1120_06389 [Exophiala dermatitidis NIH/UT8656]EHY58378.1 hypothetical protein HMPREF1120_06389 [Exophiala dermatitidis NIH/UT8656]
MTDIAQPVDVISMHYATAHASTMPDPPMLTSTPTPTQTSTSTSTGDPDGNVHHLQHNDTAEEASSQSDTHSQSQSTSTRPTALNVSTSEASSTQEPVAGQDGDTTPPTSAISAISSQGETGDSGTSRKLEDKQDLGDVVRKDEGQQSQTREQPRSSSTSQSPPPDSVSGTKRTASGQIKRSSVNGIGEVMAKSGMGTSHSRTSSMTSNGTNANVVEISQQLRTKLKYAMLKVQNGWQSRSLDEVESLASQSPRSTVSGFQQYNNSNDPQSTLLSPKTAMARKLYRNHSETSESDSSDNTTAEARGLTSPAGRSYDAPAAGRRALAPPVDIVPGRGSGAGSRRRPTPNGSYNHGNGTMRPPRPINSQRTPSQNAAMEADAVETLLFMASPNNSGYNPHASASQESSSASSLRPAEGPPPPSQSQPPSNLTSPLRTQFSQTSIVASSPKRVAFSGIGSDHHRQTLHNDYHHSSSSSKAALIDRMLDELSDTSDDELEQAFRQAEKSKPAATVLS